MESSVVFWQWMLCQLQSDNVWICWCILHSAVFFRNTVKNWLSNAGVFRKSVLIIYLCCAALIRRVSPLEIPWELNSCVVGIRFTSECSVIMFSVTEWSSCSEWYLCVIPVHWNRRSLHPDELNDLTYTNVSQPTFWVLCFLRSRVNHSCWRVNFRSFRPTSK